MSLGSTLRSARENARLSIDDLAAMTSIRSGLISQMESDNFSGCGGDTYARGHLRTIASKLNIDPQNLLNLYAVEHSAEQRSIEALLVENSVTTPPSERKKISYKTLSLVSLAILASAAVIQIVVSNSTSGKTESNSVSTVSPTPIPSPSESASESPSPSPTSSVEAGSATTINTLKIIAARGNASIDVVTKAGHLFKGWILQGESKEFSSDSRISIYLSNAGDLDLIVNGKEIPSLGAHGQEVRRTFP